jgi:hypothetical protein
VPLHHPF